MFCEQISTYFEINEQLVPTIGLFKRLRAQTFLLIESQRMLAPEELYYLFFQQPEDQPMPKLPLEDTDQQ